MSGAAFPGIDAAAEELGHAPMYPFPRRRKKPEISTRDYGTFRDSLKAPVHRWFTYPAGFSYKLVEAKMGELGIGPGRRIGDPFAGTGTVCLTAKMNGIDSIGTETHPFVQWIAEAKIKCLSCDPKRLKSEADKIADKAESSWGDEVLSSMNWPDLVHKCFSTENLQRLAALRKAVETGRPEFQSFFKIALTATLREATSAGAGWPYIAPSKFAERKVQKDAIREFWNRCRLMTEDLSIVQWRGIPKAVSRVLKADARQFSKYAGESTLDLVVTSPPYLNNYDYADRTRLETYFWGVCNSWGEVTKRVRDRLIMAATTQVRRGEMAETARLPGIAEASAEVQGILGEAVRKLESLRNEKSGKKSYDLMVAGYFEDMLKVIRETYKALRPGASFVLVVGDSAPYGVHVATDVLIGKLATAIGFRDCDIQCIRTRGDKWAGNTQRHKVPLRECIVTLTR